MPALALGVVWMFSWSTALDAQRAPRYARPDSVQLVTADIARFWRVVDRAAPESLSHALQRDYLDQGSLGLRGFVPDRIGSAAALAQTVKARRARYEEARAVGGSVDSVARAIRAPLYALEYLYPEAVYPDIYFVVGRLNSGGTATEDAVIVGVEMFREPHAVVPLVAHELIHFQQRASGQYRAAEAAPTLLAVALLEGTADFVAELLTGVRGNAAAHTYGRAHEAEVWDAFKAGMDSTSLAGWFYGDPPGKRPADLGYFVGYRIAEAYFERARDKRAALRELLTRPDFAGILAGSGYRP